MKVGDYVRTENGIKKVLNYEYNERYENGHCIWFENKDCGLLFTDEEINKMKPSPNIIDLIEVGDYVNGNKVTSFEEHNWLGFGNHDWYLQEYEIKSIVTKEQFESMKYKVGE